MSDDERCNVVLSDSECHSWKGNALKRQRGSRHCDCLEDDTKELELRVQCLLENGASG